jgi:hypothetical protein
MRPKISIKADTTKSQRFSQPRFIEISGNYLTGKILSSGEGEEFLFGRATVATLSRRSGLLDLGVTKSGLLRNIMPE